MLELVTPAAFELTVKNSRFLTEANIVRNGEEAREFLRNKKNSNADCSHVVHAFAVGPEAGILGCSDDGEPPGTAGRPMLEVLKGSGITNIILTTVRWFGGTKLGTGGLVKAYTECAQGCLALVKTREIIPMVQAAFTVPYPLYEQVKLLLSELEFQQIQEEFSEGVRLSGELREERKPQLVQRLLDLSRGKIQVE